MSQPPLLSHQKNTRVALLLFVLCGAGLFLLILLFKPTFLPPCTFHRLTGLPCPFCGGTRAASALVHGDWARSFYLNPMAFLSIAIFGFLFVLFTVELAMGRSFADWGAMLAPWKKWLPMVLVLLAGWWALHIFLAVRTPKRELLDLGNPIARTAYEKLRK